MSSLKAENRESKGNGRQLRRLGIIPAVIYGKNLDASISIQVEAALAIRMLKTNAVGSQIEITVGKEKYSTMLKDLALDPMTYKLQHMDFQVLTTGEKVSVTTRINLLNKDQVPSEGVLQELMSELQYTALPKDLIDHIDVDLAGLAIGDSIKIKDLAIGSDDRYQFGDDIETDIVHISHMKIVEEEVDEDEIGDVAIDTDVPVIGAEE